MKSLETASERDGHKNTEQGKRQEYESAGRSLQTQWLLLFQLIVMVLSIRPSGIRLHLKVLYTFECFQCV